jgi:hypothetical protein
MSNVSDDPEGQTQPERPAVSDGDERQLSLIIAALERSEERARTLERENGILAQREASLEYLIGSFEKLTAGDRQQDIQQLQDTLLKLAELKAGLIDEIAEKLGRLLAELTAERRVISTLLASRGPDRRAVP